MYLFGSLFFIKHIFHYIAEIISITLIIPIIVGFSMSKFNILLTN